MKLRSRVVHPRDLTPVELEAWERLCLADDRLRRAFLAPGFALAVGEVRPDARVAVLLDDGDPVGFFAYQFANSGAFLTRVGEPIGGDMSDYVGLVAAPHVRLEPGRLLRLARLTGFDFTHLDESQHEFGLAGEESEPGLLVDLSSGWDAYWAALVAANKDFVQKTERREKHAMRDVGPLSFQVDPSERGSALVHMIDLKRRQYGASGARDALRAPWKRELLELLANTRDESCRGEVTVLRGGTNWIATHFGLRCAERLHYWFPVFERKYSKLSPGRLLLKATLERASELGIRVVDRGAGNSQAKRDFANAEHRFETGLWHRMGLRSTAYRAGRSLAWRARDLLSRSSEGDSES